jgi:protease-4
MKQFFKFVFASMLGIILSTILLFVIFIAGITAIVSSSDEKVELTENTILHLNLNVPIIERSTSSPLDNIDLGPFKGDKVIGLDDVLKSIKYAKEDDNIKGIYLDVSYLMTGLATIEEIRDALIDFKKSKKFIYSYSEVYTQSAYYLASTADKIYLNPQGLLELKGFSGEVTFFKGALDKLGIEAQVIKVGTYKSAVEPYILDKMSDANKLQTNALLASLYNHFTLKIAESRKLSQAEVINISNKLLCRSPQDAVDLKLVDALKYKDEVLEELKKKTDVKKDDKLNTVNLSDYAKTVKNTNTSSDRIAIIYANGEITGGEGDESSIGSEGISKALRKARLDDKVKAVVFRVNSPGGSSLASDVIWREVALTKKAKPIIVSMGDYAASGGYYIACAADSIFAEPNTITGSIGVFAIIPNLKGLLNDKMGITFDGVKTGEFSDFGDITRPLTAAERMIFQTQVNRTYQDFTKIVAQGRKIPQSYVDSIGQGRVWTGEQAIKLKLVDRIGHIEDAIASAAKKANLKEYKIVKYPDIDKSFFGLMDKGGDQIKTYMVKKELGVSYQYYQKIKEVANMKGLQSRMPFLLEIN